METISQQSLYCVVTQRIVGNFVRYPEHKEFLIKSDHPVKTSDLIEAVRDYVAMQNQININWVSIYDMVDMFNPEDRKKWYDIVENKHWCYEYHNGKIIQMFL